MMKKLWTILLILLIGVVAGFVSYWIATLVKIDIQTHAHYDEFEYAYMDGTMLGDMEYFKVVYYDDYMAQVYYVSEGRSGGDLLVFENNGDAWKQVYWGTIWSSTGSASDVIWPYWWHFIYGGF